MNESVHEMWEAFRASLEEEPSELSDEPNAWHFCDNPADADTCARLVLAGRKRATTTSLWELEKEGEPLPRVGDLNVVTDGSGGAVCVIRTTGIERLTFAEVEERHAAAEGEGDGSLEFWRRVHRSYYRRALRGTNRSFREDMPLIFESFEVVYP